MLKLYEFNAHSVTVFPKIVFLKVVFIFKEYKLKTETSQYV
jgi:hypothetical protein